MYNIFLERFEASYFFLKYCVAIIINANAK